MAIRITEADLKKNLELKIDFQDFKVFAEKVNQIEEILENQLGSESGSMDDDFEGEA